MTAVPFSGRAFSVRLETTTTADGRSVTWEIVERAPAVAVLAETAGRLVLIRQYRPAVGETLWELPAGKVDPGEPAEAAARRELAEETGYVAGAMRPVLEFYPSPGYTSERVWIFHAPDVRPGPARPEPDEHLVVTLVSAAELGRLLDRGALRNGLLLVGALWWLARTRPPAG
ncbi:MAG: NUDIX hydrolase [Actinomycetia bacterium]|nr:NUDIX hydrolase [Actinomycetes bacterium]